MDIQTALITAVKYLIRVFFGYKPDWIKYFNRSTGLGSDGITERKFWTGLGLKKSPICSTLGSTGCGGNARGFEEGISKLVHRAGEGIFFGNGFHRVCVI